MARPLWFVEIIKKTFKNRFLIGRLTKIPILGRLVKQIFFGGDDIIFLPKESSIEINRSVKQPGEMVLPSQVVEYFIDRASYLWVMNFCICRSASQCKDYPINLGCLFLGEAARGINPHLGRPVTREEAKAHLNKCREHGLVHLIGRNKLDEMWLGVKPGERLMSVCNCCPCCCLYRVLPYLDSEVGEKFTAMPGVEVKVTDDCVGCGICVETCFVQAISIRENRAYISEQCRGCGRCVEKCPQNAIKLTVTHGNFLEKSIRRISRAVNVK